MIAEEENDVPDWRKLRGRCKSFVACLPALGWQKIVFTVACIAVSPAIATLTSFSAEAGSQTFESLLEALSQRESGGEYSAVNSLGYLGAYQFGELALIDLGYYTSDGTQDNDWVGNWTGKSGLFSKSDFLENPAAQDTIMRDWAARLWTYASHPELSLSRYVGHSIGNIKITPAGIIAGAHLVGIWGVASFLRSNGVDDPADPFGIQVSEYVRLFAPYSTPFDEVAPH